MYYLFVEFHIFILFQKKAKPNGDSCDSLCLGAEGSSGGVGPRGPEAAAVHPIQRWFLREKLHLRLR